MLSNTIVSIKINGEVKIGLFEIKDFLSKFSSTKIPAKRLFLDGTLVPTKNTYVRYVCGNCNKEKEILLKKFLLKNNLICRSCKERDKDKRKRQSEYMKKTYSDFGLVKSFKAFKDKKSILDIIIDSEEEFQSESEDFKINYEKMHLTADEFSEISHKIYKINDIIFNNNFEYCYSIKTNNQMKYSSYIFKDNIFTNVNNIVYICDNCSELFSSSRKPKEKYLNNHKYLCPKCYLSNRTFKIKPLKNINNEVITYQSAPELRLIDFCNKNNILIENGPTVSFYFNDKKRKYRIDYYIPKLNILIEIKGNHIWHQEQIISGRWELKEKAANDYANYNNLQYFLVFDDKLDEFINSLKI